MTRYETKWLIFSKLNFPERKTETWQVVSVHNVLLGIIKWKASWRCYAFFPAQEVVFNSTCLKDITEFIERLMLARKK